MLRFTKNNAGYHNVEGKGFNAFGKYTITGTLSMDNVIIIFRHFKPIKVKASRTPAVTLVTMLPEVILGLPSRGETRRRVWTHSTWMA